MLADEPPWAVGQGTNLRSCCDDAGDGQCGQCVEELHIIVYERAWKVGVSTRTLVCKEQFFVVIPSNAGAYRNGSRAQI